MRRYIGPILIGLITGIAIAKLYFNQYDYKTELVSMFKGTKVYFLQQGAYSGLDSMKENMKNFPKYIYTYENDKYYTFIAMTSNENNLARIKELYKQKGYDIYTKEYKIDNKEFINILNKYDSLLDSSKDNEVLEAVEGEILSKYEEMILNKN